MTIDKRSNIPTIIGGGRAPYCTRLDERHLTREAVGDLPYGLAFCDVEGSGIFPFTWEDDWMLVVDSWHASVDEAKRQAAFEFEGVALTWERPPV